MYFLLKINNILIIKTKIKKGSLLSSWSTSCLRAVCCMSVVMCVVMCSCLMFVPVLF